MRFFLPLVLAFISSLHAQKSWTIVTENIPLPAGYLKEDGSVRASRLFQLGSQSIVATRVSRGRAALISSEDGVNWENFPAALPSNYFDGSARLQTRRLFSSLDPVADLRLFIPVGNTSRLEVTYRDSHGTFLAKGYPGEQFEIPSTDAKKISGESSQDLEVLTAEFINFPDLPPGEITNIGIVDDTLIIQIGRMLYSWCADCGSNTLQGHWRTLSGKSVDTKPQKMAGNGQRAFLLDFPSEASVTEIVGTSYRVRQLIASASRVRLNDIAHASNTFVVVGKGQEWNSFSDSGLILRKVTGHDWETLLIPDENEFLSISRGSLGWLATSANGGIWSSPDGLDWHRAGGSSFPIVALIETNNRWLASTDSGAVYSSANLSNWNQQLDHVSGSRGITVAGSHFLTLGQSNLRRSPIAVEGAPDITGQPLSGSVIPNESATLTVTAVGENLAYQWFTGESGDRRNPISLTVNPILPTITSQPEDNEVDAGNFVSLRVRASGPLLSYQWYQGKSGDTSNPIPNTNSSSFTPKNDGAPETQYWVRVTNPAGHLDSSSATVLLTYSPLKIFFSSPDDRTLLVGVQSWFSLNVSPWPGVTFQWFEGESGDTSTPITGASHPFFEIPDGAPGVFSYWVRASNPVSTIDSQTQRITRIAPDYEEWLDFYGVEAAFRAPQTSAAGDSFSNLFRYLAGLSPLASAGDAFSETYHYHDPQSGDDFLALDIRTRPLPEGASLLVEQSSSLHFDGTPAIEVGTPITHRDHTISRTYRASQPISSQQQQFLRVRVTPAPE